MTLLALRMFLGGALSKLWAFLKSLSFWQLMFGAALIFGGVQTLRLKMSVRHSAKVERQLRVATETLDKLKAESKAQQVQVGKTIDHYITVTKPVIVKQREEIEAAPLPGDCHTPKAVLDADV